MLPSRTTLAPTFALCLLAVCAALPAHAQMQPIPGSASQPPVGTFARPAAQSPWDRAPGSSPWDRAPGGSTAAAAPASAPAGPSPFDQPTSEPPCIKEFIALRQDTEKKAKTVQAASKRKPSPQEACRMFTALVASQDKLGKFAAANVKGCGIPQQVVDQIKTAITQTEPVRARVCEVAARGPVPTGPSLSDALGTTYVANPGNGKRGGGSTFDTLSGNVLAR
jgi:hypothetical protein